MIELFFAAGIASIQELWTHMTDDVCSLTVT